MSKDPNRAQRKHWGWGGLAFALVGGVVGYFVGVNIFCPPGAGNDCGVLGFFVGVPIGMIAGITAYAILRRFQ